SPGVIMVPRQVVGSLEDREPAPLRQPGLPALHSSRDLRRKFARGSKPHSCACGKHEGGLEPRLSLPTAGYDGLDESLVAALPDSTDSRRDGTRRSNRADREWPDLGAAHSELSAGSDGVRS